MDPENPSTYLWMNPGKADGNLITKDKITKDGILAYIEQDAEHYGFYFEDCTTTTYYPEGAYVVALVVDPGNDYHWYRRNPNGTWSHKISTSEVIQVDGATPHS